MAAAPPDALTANLPAIESALQAALPEDGSELIQAARYVLGWQDEHGTPLSHRGKRIRPALCLFAATLFGQPAEVAMPAAVAVELIHNFSLVHDEIQDHDAERHHRPTVWVLMGEGQAINVGDFMITRAIEALVSGPGAPERRLAALAVLNRAMALMIAGQWGDISFETRASVSPEEYLAMVRGKTGALLGAPLAMGALLAGASQEQASALEAWGEMVGVAFQVHDDYLGIWGDPNLTGKSTTGDILRRKKTLPVVHGLTGTQAASVAELYRRDPITTEDVPAVVAALEAGGSDQFARSEGERLVAAAHAMLDSFELPAAAREQLRRVGAYLVDRDG